MECLFQKAKNWLSVAVPTEEQATPTAPPPGSDNEQTYDLPDGVLREKLAGLYLIWCIFHTQFHNPKVMVSEECTANLSNLETSPFGPPEG